MSSFIPRTLHGRRFAAYAVAGYPLTFDAQSDVALYGLVPEGVSFLVRAGQFALLFPEDGHIPSCAWDQPAEVFKTVVKIAV